MSNAATVAGAGAAGGIGSGNGTNGSATISFTTSAATITAPTPGKVTNDPKLPISGTGTAGATVTVTVGGDAVDCAEAPVVVASNGSWTCTPSTPIPDGTADLVAHQTDPAVPLAAYPDSAPVSLTVDTVAPAAPSITSPAPGTVLNTAAPVFTGTGEDGSTIELRDAHGTLLCTATVSGSAWSCAPNPELTEGVNTITPIARDSAGNQSTGDPVPVVVDTTAPAAPVFTSPKPGSSTNDPLPELSGTGEPGAAVTVKDQNDHVICETTVGAGGTWACTPTGALGEGDYTFTAEQTDPAGNTSPAGPPLKLIVDLTPPAPAEDVTCARQADGTTRCTGTAEPGATVEMLDPAGKTLCSATTGSAGTWSCTAATAASSLKSRVIDPAGNESPLTTTNVTPFGGEHTGSGGTPTPSTGSGATGGLATTGVDPTPMLWTVFGAIVLALSGVVLVGLRRRSP